MLPPALMAIDPGGMTGMAVLFTPPGSWGGFWCSEWPFHEFCRQFESVAVAYRDELAVFWERFQITARTHKLTPQPDAMHVIGVCRYLAAKHGCRVLPEARQATPSPGEQAQLRALGWWLPANNDAQSAAGHLLRYLVQSNELPSEEREILAGLGKGERQW
jgi:hypothetical protein